MENTDFYATAYKTGKQIQISIPYRLKRLLNIESRDELKILGIEKTGNKVPILRPNSHFIRKKNNPLTEIEKKIGITE